MIVEYVFALIAGAWLNLRNVARPLAPSPRLRAAWLTPAVVLLVVAYAAQLWLVDRAAAGQVPVESWQSLLPFRVVEDRQPYAAHTPHWIADGMLVAALLETCALAAIFVCLRAGIMVRDRIVLGAAAAIVYALAFCAPAMTSFDLYAYIGSALQGPHAYAPLAAPLPGSYAAIDSIYGVPILPSAYGPVWLAVSALFVLPHQLAPSAFLVRALGGVALLACIAALRLARANTRVIWLFALDPQLADFCIANGHNDAFPLAFALLAFACARRGTGAWWTAAAVACAVFAGAAKLPFVVLAPLAFAGRESNRARIFPAALAAAGALAASAIFGGMPYLAAIRRTMQLYPQAIDFTLFEHRVMAVVAIALVAAAVLARKRLSGGGLTMIALGSSIFPWYAIWSLPYALAVEETLEIYLITLPLLALLFTTVFPQTPLRGAFEAIVLIALAAAALARKRRAASVLPAAGATAAGK